MISVLINAYACSPDMGSEPGMAWNWCVHLAEHCELHIITEGEFRDRIEAALPALPQGRNMHFYYNPVSDEIRKMCWNQGDWRFYGHYRKWQRKTYEMGLQVIREHRIDLVHQLNMVGFREPGYMWKYDGIPVVWGPIAGFQHIPLDYLRKTDLRFAAFFMVKKTISKLQLRFAPRIRAMVGRADRILTATPEMQEAIRRYYKKETLLINETACNSAGPVTERSGFDAEVFHILWVGRFIPSKQLELALETIREVRHLPIRFHIVGAGFRAETTQHYHDAARKLGVEDICQWHGSIPNEQVHEMMRKSQLFFFSSILEATSTVILEAIQNRLPVLCFDTCGFGPLIDPRIGVRIPLTNPKHARRDFAKNIEYLFHNRNVLKTMSANCAVQRKNLDWEHKTAQVLAVYNDALKNTSR